MNRYLIRILNNPSQDLKSEHKQPIKHNLNKGDSGSKLKPKSKPQLKDNTKLDPVLDSGCQHYQRGCKLVSPCCDKVYSCRLCHDNNEDHILDRYSVSKIRCNTCDTLQDVSNKCITCSCNFGTYFCKICRFFDNADRDHYHCNKCKLCRVKDADSDTFHCDSCNICISTKDKDTHKCIDVSGAVCPICIESLATSTKTFLLNMKCNHLIHQECLSNMFENGNYKCPICSVSLVDMSDYNKLLDGEISRTIMPLEYTDTKVDILCNDCHIKSNTNYHIIGHKCSDCYSYNTRRI